MNNLSAIFPSLTLFSDLNWEEITQEYEDGHIHLSFPEYLQEKAIEGDCPPYLFEIAFYEQALFELRSSPITFPHLPGIHLNPSLMFLNLEFDVVTMLEKARNKDITVVEKEHILALYKDQNDELHSLPLTVEEIRLLGQLEDGPLQSDELRTRAPVIFQDLVRKKLIFDLLT